MKILLEVDVTCLSGVRPSVRYFVEPRQMRDGTTTLWAVVDAEHIERHLPRIYETFATAKSANVCADQLNSSDASPSEEVLALAALRKIQRLIEGRELFIGEQEYSLESVKAIEGVKA